MVGRLVSFFGMETILIRCYVMLVSGRVLHLGWATKIFHNDGSWFFERKSSDKNVNNQVLQSVPKQVCLASQPPWHIRPVEKQLTWRLFQSQVAHPISKVLKLIP